MRNNPNLDVFNINAYTKLCQIPSIISQNIEQKRNSDINSVIYLWKFMRDNPNLDFVNINAYAKFGQIPSIRSQDIERKRNSDINQGP